MAAQIVDDILIIGENESVNEFIQHFDATFQIGTVAHGPRRLQFYGLNIMQPEDF